MTDLTAITTPFGLLDPETQKALHAHGGPYEMYTSEGWRPSNPLWDIVLVYRVKPEPPPPREWWLNVYPNQRTAAHKTKQAADKTALFDRLECIHVREVL